MPKIYLQFISKFQTLLLVLASVGISSGQTTYFSQDFSQTRSFVNPSPDSGQFSHILLTAPTLSYYKFHKGYMELIRTQQDSASGGIIRALRATPFTPNPETLIIQMKVSVESMQSSTMNAVYFYVGEDFNPVNNSFPGNTLMFAKCSINFHGNNFTVKDLETQLTSKNIPVKTPVTITWVLNNSTKQVPYSLSDNKNKHFVLQGSYDLWVDNELVNKSSKAYPGGSPYSKSKLSNFEMRFRNGLGKLRIHNILIREAVSDHRLPVAMVFPNPASGKTLRLEAYSIVPASIEVLSITGKSIPFKKLILSPNLIEIKPDGDLAAGIYVLSFRDTAGTRRSTRVMIN